MGDVRLAERAKRAAAKPNTIGKPAGEFPPELAVVPLEQHLYIEAQTHHSLQKSINRLTAELHKAERGLENRKRSLDKAHEYIKDLKQKLREAGVELAAEVYRQ